MSKGILLIALGHRNYLHMAAALAASIQANDPSVQICLATDQVIAYDHLKLFHQHVLVDPSIYTVNGKPEYIKAKLHLYELSPFQQTIFLDVDQIVLSGRKLSEVFAELTGTPFTIANTGASDYSIWADVKEVKQLYGEKPFWNFHSEFIYFEKSRVARTFFLRAQKAYTEAKVKSATRFAGGTMADELALAIASIRTGTAPHQEGWLPNYWHAREKVKGLFPYQIAKSYYTYSIGGPYTPHSVAQNYNNLAAYYYQKLGLQNPYTAKSKSGWLRERQKI